MSKILPSVPQILLAPELPLVTLLERLLDLLRPTLVAQHPTLATETARSGDPPTLLLARALLRDGDRLRRMIRCYERAVLESVANHTRIDDELPF